MTDIQNMPLAFHEKLQLGVETGTITSTVRKGYRNYKPGIVLANDPDGGKVKWGKHLHILEVRFTEARNVEAEMMGWESQAAWYEEMRTFYEDFSPDTEVTVIYFILPDRVEQEKKEIDELNDIVIEIPEGFKPPDAGQ